MVVPASRSSLCSPMQAMTFMPAHTEMQLLYQPLQLQLSSRFNPTHGTLQHGSIKVSALTNFLRVGDLGAQKSLILAENVPALGVADQSVINPSVNLKSGNA